MAFRDYTCEKCNYSFEENLSVEDREKPCQIPCPECGGKIYIDISRVHCGFSFRGEVRRKPEGVFNDRLKEIKKKFPRNRINVIE